MIKTEKKKPVPAPVVDPDAADQDAMFKLYQERGPMTDVDLERAGISRESQARNAAAVAERIRLSEQIAA
ncbi:MULTISPECIES: hypothetical protein [Rhizobium]|uniref:hypothetical protein n=1 Tax=Rhizobium phaseoli TaxID=396 RepID=UPI000A1C178D|nr:hypothetical protein [Rhizobium phaseoli]ARM12096.1 hypothetical protein Bra5_CH01859 [Rhizobium phaseoli Brasil 5]